MVNMDFPFSVFSLVLVLFWSPEILRSPPTLFFIGNPHTRYYAWTLALTVWQDNLGKTRHPRARFWKQLGKSVLPLTLDDTPMYCPNLPILSIGLVGRLCLCDRDVSGQGLASCLFIPVVCFCIASSHILFTATVRSRK
jgi:hypothetical protein